MSSSATEKSQCCVAATRLVCRRPHHGCVAKTGSGLVKVVFVLTVASLTHLSMNPNHPFKWRHFQSQIILLCVRWYLRYPLSYRNLEEMMMERGLTVDHSTVYRWIQAYAPELDKRCRPYLKPTNDSGAS